MEHLWAVKFAMGFEKNELSCGTKISKSSKKLKKIGPGFFLGEEGLSGGQNFTCPPTHRRPRFLTWACPPNWVLSLNFQKF